MEYEERVFFLTVESRKHNESTTAASGAFNFSIHILMREHSNSKETRINFKPHAFCLLLLKYMSSHKHRAYNKYV